MSQRYTDRKIRAIWHGAPWWRWPDRMLAFCRRHRKPLYHPLAGGRPEATPVSRDVTPDIEWLLKLASKLNYLWRSCTGEVSEQNDLFLLTYALETAKDMQWTYRLLGDREWSGRYAVALSDGLNGIYLSRTSLDVAFDDKGRQINPLTARLAGNVAGVMVLLDECGWQAKSAQNASLTHQYLLMARQGTSEKND